MENENQKQKPGQDGSKPIKTKAIQTPYDYVTLLKMVEAHGAVMCGHPYKIHDIDRSPILKLLAYFLQDKAIVEDDGLDLRKGVLVTGPVGCGKSSIVKILRKMTARPQHLRLYACREVALDYALKGHEVILSHSRNAYYPYTVVPRTHIYDDLGLEGLVKYWGNDCNVMAEILLSRYDMFLSTGMITHVTTNLNSSEIEAVYGNRLRSRMREMFNLIAFDFNSLDKRL